MSHKNDTESRVKFLFANDIVDSAETSICEWGDVKRAIELATDMIKNSTTAKRLNFSIPFAFQFIQIHNGIVTRQSGIYYLGGKVYTYGELVLLHDSNQSALRYHMEINGWDHAIITNIQWEVQRPFFIEKDVLLTDEQLTEFTNAMKKD